MSVSISEGKQISSTIYTGKMDATSTVGCFAQQTPLVDHGEYTWQSSGNCQKICYALGMPVMGLTSGTNCACGDQFPPKDSLVDTDKCSSNCTGYPLESCGGANLWWVLTTGQSHNEIDYLDVKHLSSSAVVSHSVVTMGGSTVIETVPAGTPTESAAKSHSSGGGGGGGGSNKAGIAAGVVVGIVVLAAIIGGVFFFLRRRRQRLAEKEYQQKQSVQQFVAGGKGSYPHSQSSINDSRLDPSFMSRRQSDGSIADNQDYSRRILKITNPDGH